VRLRSAGALDLLCVGVLAGCALILHRDGLVGGPAFYERDTQLFYYPLAQWVGDQLRAGNYPLWLPGIFTGYPIFADGELGLLYLPQVLLLRLLSAPLAIAWLRVLHVFLAGSMTFWFLRTLRLQPLPALGGGLVFALGSFLTAQMHHENVIRSAVWLPAVLGCAERAMRSPTLRRLVGWASLGALAFAQAALGLHVQPVLMTMLAVAWFVLFRMLAKRASWPWRVGAGAGIVAGGFALAAAQWLPLGEWALVSSRRGGVEYEFASAFAISAENLPTLVFPFFFRLADATTWWSLWQQWETELYVGIPTLALVIVGIVFGRRLELLFFVPLGLVSLWIAMANYAPLLNLHILLWSVPGFSFLRAPSRFGYLFVFACACVAAIGLQVLQYRRPRLLIALCGTLPAVATLAALLAVLPAWRDWLLADATRARTYVETTYLATRAQYPIDPHAVVNGLVYSLDPAAPKTAWSMALLLLTALGFVAWLGLGARRALIGQSVLVALIAADLLVFAYDFHPRAPLASFAVQPPPGVLRGERVLLLGSPDLPEFEPNQLLTISLGAVEGYSSLPSQRHVELEDETQRQPSLFDLWSARYIFEPTNPPDARELNSVRFRTEHPLLAGFGNTLPPTLRVPDNVGEVTAVRIVGTLSYAFNVPQSAEVAVLLVSSERLRLRAGVELAERAYDRPSLRGLVQHQKPAVAYDFEEATPQGEAYVGHLYYAELPLASPSALSAVTLVPSDPNVLVEIHGVSLVTANGVRPLAFAHLNSLQAVSPGVFENTRALPRAFVLPREQAYSPARHPGLTATQIVGSPDVDVHRRVLIENDPSVPAEPGDGTVDVQPARLVDIGPNGVQVIATAEVPSYLVVDDFYHRGWTARVDGQSARVLIANALFRAVAIEPGQHVVEFRFEPLSHLLGALVSMLSLGLCVGAIVWGLRGESGR
jgi:hypothetical protein